MTEPWDLPDGWEWATFRDVAQIASDLVSPADHQDEPHIAPNHIESGSGRLLPYTTIAADKVTSPKHRFRPGQILYSKIRPYLCKAVRVDFRGLCSADMYPITAKIDAGYLHRWMLSLTFTEWASGAQGRTVLPKINQEALSVIQVPVPPLAEQRRIVAKIEELTARSRAARAALAEVPTLLEQFRQSVLASAFRGDLTADWRTKNPDAESASVLLERIRTERRKQWETKYPKKKYVEPKPVDDSDLPELPEGWCWATADELCAQITDGEHIQPKYQNSGRPMLTAKHVREGYVSQDGAGLISEADYKSCRARCAPATGDILIVSVGATTGRTAVVGQESNFALVRSVLLLKPLVSSAHFLYWTKAPFCYRWMTQASGATAQAHLYINDTKRMPIPLAPEEESSELCRRLAEVLTAHREQLLSLEVAQQDLDVLDQSIFAKAFRGELVPQDPADESAATLLARIRSGGSSTTPATPTRSAKRGQVKAYILLLLRTWNKPLGREMLERGLVLMLNADVRRGILGRSEKTSKPAKRRSTPPRFVSGMDALLGEMIDDRWLMPGPEAGFFAEGQHGIDLTAAPPSDLDAVRETAEVMKVLHKDRQQATDADIVSALNGEIYELVY